MIDLGRVKDIMREVDSLIESLHGEDLDERKAVEDQSKARDRRERARMSQDLNLLRSRLQLAAQLVDNEYWFARGESDPLQPNRGSDLPS